MPHGFEATIALIHEGQTCKLPSSFFSLEDSGNKSLYDQLRGFKDSNVKLAYADVNQESLKNGRLEISNPEALRPPEASYTQEALYKKYLDSMNDLLKQGKTLINIESVVLNNGEISPPSEPKLGPKDAAPPRDSSTTSPPGAHAKSTSANRTFQIEIKEITPYPGKHYAIKFDNISTGKKNQSLFQSIEASSMLIEALQYSMMTNDTVTMVHAGLTDTTLLFPRHIPRYRENNTFHDVTEQFRVIGKPNRNGCWLQVGSSNKTLCLFPSSLRNETIQSILERPYVALQGLRKAPVKPTSDQSLYETLKNLEPSNDTHFDPNKEAVLSLKKDSYTITQGEGEWSIDKPNKAPFNGACSANSASAA